MRIPGFILTLAVLVASCGQPRYSYVFTKAHLSVAQELEDQQYLLHTAGVGRVIYHRQMDNSATVEVGCNADARIRVQLVLLGMGYKPAVE